MIDGLYVASVLMILAVTTFFFIPRLLGKKASLTVIDRFCRQEAVSDGKARAPKELGLTEPNLFQRLTNRRDLEQLVVRSFRRRRIIRFSREGKMYLVEDRLRDQYRCKR